MEKLIKQAIEAKLEAEVSYIKKEVLEKYTNEFHQRLSKLSNEVVSEILSFVEISTSYSVDTPFETNVVIKYPKLNFISEKVEENKK